MSALRKRVSLEMAVVSVSAQLGATGSHTMTVLTVLLLEGRVAENRQHVSREIGHSAHKNNR